MPRSQTLKSKTHRKSHNEQCLHECAQKINIRLGRRKSSDADVPYLRISSRNRSSTDICLEIGRTCCELASHHSTSKGGCEQTGKEQQFAVRTHSHFGQLVSEE